MMYVHELYVDGYIGTVAVNAVVHEDSYNVPASLTTVAQAVRVC